MPDFKENINSWSPKEDEWQQDSKEYQDKLKEYSKTISGLLDKENEKLIGTFDIESTLLNGRLSGVWQNAKHNTANPGAIALIRFLKEQKDDKYESSIASVANVGTFDAHKLLDQNTFFKNDKEFEIYNSKDGGISIESKEIEGIKEAILGKTDTTQLTQMKSLLSGLYLRGGGGTLNKKCSVVFEALYRKFILKEENINMLFFDNDIGYIEGDNKSITNFLDSKLDDTAVDTVRVFLTGLGITITPICAASGHITFEQKAGEDRNQSRKQAVFLNDLAREVMKEQGLDQNEIDKKMLEAEKICFEEYVSRTQNGKLDGKDTEIKQHIDDLDKQIKENKESIKTPPPPPPSPPPSSAPPATDNTIVVKKCTTSGNGLLCFMHAAFGEKEDNKYQCSDISKKTQELKASIIADVTAKFDGNNDADKKKLIAEYTILLYAEIGATTDSNEKILLQTSLLTLNDPKITDDNKQQTIINCIDKIKNTFPLIWFSYAAKMNKNNIVLISEYNNDGNFHIDEHSVENSTNDIYIHFDGTRVGHFSRCEKIAYKQKLDADEINVSDIRLEQLIEEIYAKQRGIIDNMKNYTPLIIKECFNKPYLDVVRYIEDLKKDGVTFDYTVVQSIINKKHTDLNNLTNEKLKKIIPDKDGIDKIVTSLKDMKVISFDFDNTITKAHSWDVTGLKKDNAFNAATQEKKQGIKTKLFGNDEKYINQLKYFFAEIQKSGKTVVINSRQYKSNIKDILDYIGIDSTNIEIIGCTEQKNNKEESLLELYQDIDTKKILHLDDDKDEIKKFQKINTYRIDDRGLFDCLKTIHNPSHNASATMYNNPCKPKYYREKTISPSAYKNYSSRNQNQIISPDEIYLDEKNNQLDREYPKKIMSPRTDNAFKNDKPIDKNISADYINPYVAKLKELQEKAQKIGIFSRIILAICSFCSSSWAKKRSAIKKLKTISIKNEDKPSYKDDKEMYDLLKKCLDDNKSFVSDIPTLPLENNVIYNHKKMQATQFDLRDMPATKEPQHNSHQLSLQQRNSGESNNSKLGY
jgi:hypothetical protein